MERLVLFDRHRIFIMAIVTPYPFMTVDELQSVKL